MVHFFMIPSFLTWKKKLFIWCILMTWSTFAFPLLKVNEFSPISKWTRKSDYLPHQSRSWLMLQSCTTVLKCQGRKMYLYFIVPSSCLRSFTPSILRCYLWCYWRSTFLMEFLCLFHVFFGNAIRNQLLLWFHSNKVEENHWCSRTVSSHHQVTIRAIYKGHFVTHAFIFTKHMHVCRSVTATDLRTLYGI